MPTRFTWNQNPGMDVIHAENPWEQCNTDDAIGTQKVEFSFANTLIKGGAAKACEHCLDGDLLPPVDATPIDE